MNNQITSDAVSEALMDTRTGRPFGDHGTAVQAINYAIEHENRLGGPMEFLCAWWEGDLEEWPEFYNWLREQEGQAS